MKRGGGKSKGSQFERDICKQLSLWITAGKREDCLWRSAMSGGRATVSKRKGIDVRQTGDICAVSPEGHALTDYFFIECKHYKNLAIDSFFITQGGILHKFWDECRKKARNHDLNPMLIAKQNNKPAIVLTYIRHLDGPLKATTRGIEIRLLSDLLRTRFLGRKSNAKRRSI